MNAIRWLVYGITPQVRLGTVLDDIDAKLLQLLPTRYGQWENPVCTT